MKVAEARFAFSYYKKNYRAKVCMIGPEQQKTFQSGSIAFDPNRYPMLRVSLDTGEKNNHVFIFWNIKPGELFWHDLPDEWKQGMAKKIAHTLLESF